MDTTSMFGQILAQFDMLHALFLFGKTSTKDYMCVQFPTNKRKKVFFLKDSDIQIFIVSFSPMTSPY